MTKRDYEAMAAEIRAAIKPFAWYQGDMLAGANKVIDAVADTFAADNDRFDRERFIEAIFKGQE